MSEESTVFGMKAPQALALYSATLTVIAMMQDMKSAKADQELLEDAATSWYTFCSKRGMELPKPAEGVRKLRAAADVKVL